MSQHWNGFQNPGQIAEGIQPCFLDRLNQAVNHRAGLGAQRDVGKREVLSVHHKGLDATLRPVVAQIQLPVLQIPQEMGHCFLRQCKALSSADLGAAGTESGHAKSASEIGFPLSDTVLFVFPGRGF